MRAVKLPHNNIPVAPRGNGSLSSGGPHLWSSSFFWSSTTRKGCQIAFLPSNLFKISLKTVFFLPSPYFASPSVAQGTAWGRVLLPTPCRCGAGKRGVGRCRMRPALLSAVMIIQPKQINSHSPSCTKDVFPWPPRPGPAFPPHMHLAY